MIVSGRYELQHRIGSGGMGTVYRAWDKLTGRHVAVKRIDTRDATRMLSPQSTHHTEFHLKLAREFNILSSLHHPNIIKVLDYGFQVEQEPYYVMEYLEASQNIIEASKGMSIYAKIGLLTQLLQAVVYLHRRDILHRDLKPDNIMVVNGSVRVLDFGLAVMKGVISQEKDQIVGTFAYMSPETIGGKPATRKTDMYALGLIAYEMFAEEYPFNTNTINELLIDIMRTQLDATRLGIPMDVAKVINQMMIKDEEIRPDDVQAILRELSAITHHPASFETDEIRESYLRSTNFVGRQDSLEQLQMALENARSGQGGVWLIAGESGIGKSRIIDELRIWSLIKGDQVWTGQATQERKIPFQTWYDPLCYMALANSDKISDDDAAILKNIIPGIAQLLERDIQEKTLSGNALLNAVNQIVTNTLLQQEHCTLIILEDLQWAVGSIDLLKALSPMLAHMRVLVVGSYRSDERPNLPEQLPDARIMSLSRFTTIEIKQLTVSILGESEKTKAVTKLVHQETEGNPFFVTEVIRQLAESAGDLQRIAENELPDTISSDNIREILTRRFSKFPEDVKAFLDLAAIAGRELDIRLLQHAAQANRESMDYWLMQGANGAVLEVKGEKWRFAHGKLRDLLLETIHEDMKRELHELLALSIEELYGKDDDASVLILAHHWQAAGNVVKQKDFVVRAGKLAIQYNDFQSAIRWYETALQIVDNMDAREQTRIHSVLGEVYDMMGDLAQASTHVNAALELFYNQDDRQGIANSCNQLGIISFRQKDHEAALTYLKQCLQMFQEIGDAAGEERTLNQLGGIYIELGEEETALQYYNEAIRFQQRR